MANSMIIVAYARYKFYFFSMRGTDELVMASDPEKLAEIAKELARCGRKISGVTFEGKEMRITVARDGALEGTLYAALGARPSCC